MLYTHHNGKKVPECYPTKLKNITFMYIQLQPQDFFLTQRQRELILQYTLGAKLSLFLGYSSICFC